MRITALLVTAMLLAPAVRAQTAPPSREQQLARWNAHHGDFDYLLGDWAFTSRSKQYGLGRGFWSARLLDVSGAVLDEYRVTGDSGETYYASYTLRAYNAAADEWELVTVDSGTGLRNIGTGHLVNGEMHIEQTFAATSPAPERWRIRYYDIRPDRFSWAADRSTDGGRTWTANFLTIEARRIGPPREFAPLARPREP